MTMQRKTYLTLGLSLLLLFSLLIRLSANRGTWPSLGERPAQKQSVAEPVPSEKLLNDFNWNFLSRGILHIVA